MIKKVMNLVNTNRNPSKPFKPIKLNLLGHNLKYIIKTGLNIGHKQIR